MVHRSVKKRPQHCSTAVGQGTILRHVGAAAGKEVQANPCGPFLHRGCNQTKGNPKTVGFWRRFCSLLPPWAKGCRAGARNIPAVGMKEKRCGPSRTPAPTGCATEAAKKRPASGSRNAFFTSYHKSAKDCNAGSAFPAAGHCIWTRGE